MSQLQSITDAINARLIDCVFAQEAHRLSVGEYRQLLWSHSYPPADGEEVVSDNVNSTPHDRLSYNWQPYLGLLPNPSQSRVRVDVYGQGAIAGFLIIAEKYDGDVLKRAVWDYNRLAQGWIKKPLTAADWEEVENVY